MSELVDLRVLILEDNPFQRSVLVAVLRSLGVGNVIEAADGQAGLDVLSTSPEPIDIVITDIAMEGMDGLEFIRRMAQFGVGGLILCSAYDDGVLASAEWMARAYNAPLIGVLRKPLEKNALKALIGRRDASRTVMSNVFGAACLDDVNSDALEEIQTGLTTLQFTPFYQPKVCLKTGRAAGVEVLARWLNPTRGLLSPVHFIDLMERFDMIDALTYTMLEQSCRDVKSWAEAGIEVPIALNVSPVTMEQPHCTARLLSIIAKAGVKPQQVTIEITEQAFARDPRVLLENALRLRVNGCRVSVDDYGVGYSSLQQISRLPVTEIKLDRSFIKDIQRDAKAMSIVESTIALAGKLGLKTVAEGLETTSQQECLAKLGCEVGQGYLFGRPMSFEHYAAWRAPVHEACPA